MKPWTVLAEITKNDSKNAKQAIILREANAGNDDFFKGVRLCYDAMITFGVKKVDAKDKKDSGSGIKSSVFFDLADKLRNRELTGDAARDAIDAVRAKCTVEEWNGWYRLILIKDLKAGFSESTVNKACKGHPEYIVPTFEVQLAKDCVNDEGDVDESLLCGKKQVDVKLDGMRCITIVYPADRQVVQYSRNGKELLNFGKIKEQIAKNAKSFTEPTILDGEVMSASFQDLMKQARRKTDVQADDSVLNLFDIITLREFEAGKSKDKQSVRTATLAAWFKKFGDTMPNVNAIGSEVVDLDTKAGQKRLAEINVAALAGKYEGIMLKDVDAKYECKRSTNWLKMKPFIEESLTILDVEEGDADSKFVGTMGALVCGGVVNGKDVLVNVGSGYSIQLRAQIWADFTGKPVTWMKKVKQLWVKMTEKPSGRKLRGMVVEVRADALTKSRDSDTWSMRFPRFKAFRGFKVGEKL